MTGSGRREEALSLSHFPGERINAPGKEPPPEKPNLLFLHKPRTLEELREEAEKQLEAYFPGLDMAILLVGEEEESYQVEVTAGNALGFRPGDLLKEADLEGRGWVSLPLMYDLAEVGIALLEAPPQPWLEENLRDFLAHYTTALVNLKLNEETARTTQVYSMSLQTLEMGIYLFKEKNKEAAGASFLDICLSMVGADGGAIYLLEEAGDQETRLILEHNLGVPEEILENLRYPDGTWLPQVTLREGKLSFFSRKGQKEILGGLDTEMLPLALENLVVSPLSYNGLDVGVCVLLNIKDLGGGMSLEMESLRRLLELGAAIFHRWAMEEQAVRNQNFQTQLQVASVIQKQLLPREAPDNWNYQFSWTSVAAQFVGGDYLDIIPSPEGDINTVIADVSGHGLNSALLMSSFRATFREKASYLDPGFLLTQLNRTVISEVADTGMFVTAALVRLSKDGRRFLFASAGHNPVLLYRPAEDEFLDLEASGPPLGLFPSAEYETSEHEAGPGDVLVMYTDGLVEATDPSGKAFFGEGRLKGCIRAHGKEGADHLREWILKSFHAFTGTTRQEDDISISIVRFL